ncbi:MAG: HEPN domain-containing protein [Candidatus Kapabacteria bacterium]|nr:HEPN domain-containing protein [Ignavibacteriota bacterium]MCW5885402.1 HEPN domain-containing protein [Candidatus Kapabacteria bacterium]
MKESFRNRALENIRAAEVLFEQEFFNASANRAYYAAFHAAISAILSIGIEPKIEHKPVHSIFTENYFNR